MATLAPPKHSTSAPKKAPLTSKKRVALKPKAPAKPTRAPLPKKAPANAPRSATKPAIVAMEDGRKLTLSRNGKALGRPRLAREPLGQVQTRIPGGLSDYLKMLALERLPDQAAPFRTMQKMFESLFARFLDERPWDSGLAWRESHSVARFSAGAVTERTEWKQLNIQLPIALTQRIETTANALGRSQSSFCYTALCWWAGMLYPPVAARGR